MTAAEHAEQVKEELGRLWLPDIYRDRVLKTRTRSYHFEKFKKNALVETQHTLLGVELKIGNRRLQCPDLATARYLAVFARAGCTDVAVPYDITRISQLADELESSWHRMLLLANHNAAGGGDAFRARIRGLLIAKLQTEVTALGAGARVPEFRQARGKGDN